MKFKDLVLSANEAAGTHGEYTLSTQVLNPNQNYGLFRKQRLALLVIGFAAVWIVIACSVLYAYSRAMEALGNCLSLI